MNSPFSNPTKRIYFRAVQGQFVTGYKSQNNLTVLGKQFAGILKGVSDIPEQTRDGKEYEASWEFAFETGAGEYVLTMLKKEWKCAPLFSALASLSPEDFKKPLELVAWCRKKKDEQDNPTVYIFLKKNGFRDDVPQKHPRLRDGEQPVSGVAYMPEKTPVIANGKVIKGMWNFDNEVNFIRENILPTIYEGLADAEFHRADEIPGDDPLTQDDLPESLNAAPASNPNEIKQKVNNQAAMNLEGMAPPPEEFQEGFPF